MDRLSALAARRADFVIGVHPDWRINVPVHPRRYAYVPNIVDDGFFETERRPQRGHVLYCGGSAAIKGWDLLAEAWPAVVEEIPHATLEATGFDEPAAGAAGRRIAGAEIRGWLTGAELRASMERAGVLVVPSQFEVAPVIIAEAWAAGVPVVAAAVGGIPGMTTGAAVIAEREPQSFARATADVLLGRVDVDALVREGRVRAEACRLQNVTDAHVRIYRGLLG